jgi:hypothetical protein
MMTGMMMMTNRHPMTNEQLQAEPTDDLIEWCAQLTEQLNDLPRCNDGAVHPNYLLQSSALQCIRQWVSDEINRRPDVLRPAFGG